MTLFHHQWVIAQKSQNKKNVSHGDHTTRRSTNHINLYDTITRTLKHQIKVELG